MRTLSLATASFIFASAPFSAPRAADAIIVVDATAQMNARLGQMRKIDVVKRQVASFVRKAGSGNRVAVWAFGTTPSHTCEDARALAPLQSPATGAAAVESALATVQPKAGRAPVLLTLQKALQADASLSSDPVAAVVVAGTGDDCVPDICAGAEKLKADYPRLKLSVLGIGMAEGSAAKFACAAKALGGTFVAVRSAADLERNLTQALDLPKNPAEPPPAAAAPAKQGAEPQAPAPAENAAAQPAAATKVPEKPAQAPTQPEPNTTLSAMLAAGGPTLDAGVSFNVYRITVSPTGQVRISENPVWSGGGGLAKLKLADGKYLVKAAYGYASGSAEFTVAGSKAEAAVSLDAGSIAVEALEVDGGPRAERALVAVIGAKPPGGGELGRSSEMPAVFYVNAGEYKVRVASGETLREAAVAVEPNKVSNVRIALDLGVLEIKTTVPQATAPAASVWHRLYRARAGGAKPTPALNLEGADARVELPAGEYRLQTLFGASQVETAVTVRAGQVTAAAITVAAGEAKVNAVPGKGRRACDAFEAGKGRSSGPLARAAGLDVSFILGPGSYDIVCRRIEAPSEIAEGQVQVVAGETQAVKFGP